MDVFDYKMLPACQYSVPVKWRSVEQETDCGEEAVAVGWWENAAASSKTRKHVQTHLCREHLDFILEKENADER